MKKGISLIVLIVTTVIIIILLGTTAVSGIKVIQRAGKIKFATELSYVQELVDTYNIKNGKYPVLNEELLDISKINDISQFDDEDILNENISLYRLDMAIIGIYDLKYGNASSADDIFLVSPKTGKIYYMRGYNSGNNTYYTLTSELRELIGYNYKGRQNSIQFINSSNGYVNYAPKVSLIIPKEYQILSLVLKQKDISDVNITEYKENENGKVYSIEDVENNYDIVVRYKKYSNDVENESMYSVTNFDNEAPVFEVSDVKFLENNDINKKYFNIESKSDNLSGIKLFKYANMVVKETELKQYFSKNGIPVKEDIVIIDDGVRNITLYMEDNAGNFSYSVVRF